MVEQNVEMQCGVTRHFVSKPTTEIACRNLDLELTEHMLAKYNSLTSA